MEEINNLNQTIADIFKTESPLAKDIKKRETQIKDAVEKLNKIKIKFENNSNFDNDTKEFLNIFYSVNEYKKQFTRLERLTDKQKIASLYSIVASKMDVIDQKKKELEEITNI